MIKLTDIIESVDKNYEDVVERAAARPKLFPPGGVMEWPATDADGDDVVQKQEKDDATDLPEREE